MPKKIADVSKKIIHAATAIYRSEGIEAISVRKVAAGCGLAVGTVYTRFEDKKQLLAQVLAGDIENLKAAMMQAVFGKQPEEALFDLTENFIGRMMEKSNNILKYVVDMKPGEDYVDRILGGACSQVKEMVQEIISRVYANKDIALDAETAVFITEAALSMMHAASRWGCGGTGARAQMVYGMLTAYDGGGAALEAELELVR